MTHLVTPALRRLAGTVLDLRERVRLALAGELATAVSNAVRDVVAAGLRGDTRLPSDPARPAGRWHEPDPWDDDPSTGYGRVPSESESPNVREIPYFVPPLVAAAVTLTRWWLRRRGTVLGAVAVGLAAVVAGAAGGPLARVGLAFFAGTADLFAVTDALGRVADRYGDV